MESPRILMARFLLVGLYDIEPLEPIVRERERTLLAAGLHTLIDFLKIETRDESTGDS